MCTFAPIYQVGKANERKSYHSINVDNDYIPYEEYGRTFNECIIS